MPKHLPSHRPMSSLKLGPMWSCSNWSCSSCGLEEVKLLGLGGELKQQNKTTRTVEVLMVFMKVQKSSEIIRNQHNNLLKAGKHAGFAGKLLTRSLIRKKAMKALINKFATSNVMRWWHQHIILMTEHITNQPIKRQNIESPSKSIENLAD